MNQIVVCHEKHGTGYYDASTLEAWAASALAILTDRWNQGYWYHDPDDDGLGTSEWAEKRREEQQQALSLTKEQVDALPEAARNAVQRLRESARRDSEQNRRYRAWYAQAKQVVEAQDTSLVTVGRGRYERQEPKAWRLLDERSDAEYERVELEEVFTPLISR